MPNPHLVCARCAEDGGGCCRDVRVFLTLGDVERIAARRLHSEFWEYAAPAPGRSGADGGLDEVWDRTRGADGGRRVLRHAGTGACVFLAPDGCALEMEARPLVCRLYPFEYSRETITGVNGHLCPDGANAPLLLALLGMNRDDAERWRRQLYREILEEFPDA